MGVGKKKKEAAIFVQAGKMHFAHVYINQSTALHVREMPDDVASVAPALACVLPPKHRITEAV